MTTPLCKLIDAVEALCDKVDDIEALLEAPVVETDIEFVCNTVSGFFDVIETTYTDGVQTAQTTQPTNIACVEGDPPPDYERVRECRNDTLHIVTVAFAADGTETEVSAIDTGEDCTKGTPECVESQEWTYGIDNTGTNFRWADATYLLTLSDGSTLTFQQTTASNPGWTDQLEEWAANVQAAADAAGLVWLVEPRFVTATNLTGGGGGLLGAPSEAVGQALYDGGMRWRYMNIQICPGQPVPVDAQLIAVDDPAGAAVPALPRSLVAAGAVLGPVTKYQLCRTCGEEPVWYEEDGVTPAVPPFCYEPCGTLALTDAPPDRACDFEFADGCDNVGQTDPANFVPGVVRRVTICSGEITEVAYFTTGPDSLEDYTLVGEFVDCASGLPVGEPVPECEDPVHVGFLYRTTFADPGVNELHWGGADALPHGPVTGIFTGPITHPNAPTIQQVVPDWNDNDVELGNPQPGSQSLWYGYVTLDEGGFVRDNNANTGETLAWYVGECCGAPELKFEQATNTVGGDTGQVIGYLPAGTHFMAFQISDLSAFGGVNLQVSGDGQAWVAMPNPTLTKPTVDCFNVIRCASGQLYDATSGKPIKFDPATDSWKAPSCEPGCCGDGGSDEPVVADTIVQTNNGGQIVQFWHVMTDGTYQGPFAGSVLP